MSQPETAQVAAALTQDILSDFVQSHGDDNAARLLAEMQGEPAAAPPAAPVASSPTPAADAAPAVTLDLVPAVAEPVAETPDEPEPAVVDFTPQLDDDYRALIEEPDFDEEALAEIQAEHDPDTYDETFDAQTAAKERAKDKRIQYLEQQLVRSNKGKWAAEAKRSFPIFSLPEMDRVLDGIQATSRRGFAREAAKLNEHYTAVLGPQIQALKAAQAAAREVAEKEARAKAAEQWGLPAAEPAGTAAVSVQDQALREARERGASLEERIKILAGLTRS